MFDKITTPLFLSGVLLLGGCSKGEVPPIDNCISSVKSEVSKVNQCIDDKVSVFISLKTFEDKIKYYTSIISEINNPGSNFDDEKKLKLQNILLENFFNWLTMPYFGNTHLDNIEKSNIDIQEKQKLKQALGKKIFYIIEKDILNYKICKKDYICLSGNDLYEYITSSKVLNPSQKEELINKLKNKFILEFNKSLDLFHYDENNKVFHFTKEYLYTIVQAKFINEKDKEEFKKSIDNRK